MEAGAATLLSAMKIKFECPFCGQRISATTDDIGVRTICPACSKQFNVPDPDAKEKLKESKSNFPPPLLNESKKAAIKTCPKCGEEIPAGEEKCKRCEEKEREKNKEDEITSSEDPDTTDRKKGPGVSVIDGIFEIGVDFFESIARVAGVSYKAVAVWIFCIIWPLVTLGLAGAVVWLLKHR